MIGFAGYYDSKSKNNSDGSGGSLKQKEEKLAKNQNIQNNYIKNEENEK